MVAVPVNALDGYCGPSWQRRDIYLPVGRACSDFQRTALHLVNDARHAHVITCRAAKGNRLICETRVWGRGNNADRRWRLARLVCLIENGNPDVIEFLIRRHAGGRVGVGNGQVAEDLVVGTEQVAKIDHACVRREQVEVLQDVGAVVGVGALKHTAKNGESAILAV